MLNILKYINNSTFYLSSSVVSKLNMSVAAVGSILETNSLKRESPDEMCNFGNEAKKALLMKGERVKRRKMAMLIAYLGQGYLGLQRNPGTKTIEEELLTAMLKAEVINEETYNQPQLIQFQRAARTDKGVSALQQVLSMKLPENTNIDAVNEHLPEQIRVICIKRATRGFNCKSNCDARTYSYTSPTFAFAPHNMNATEAYRLKAEDRNNVSEILKMYEGTHNFHNFTAKKLSTDPSVQRYMMNFTCGDPFIINDLEFVTLKVKGQSFMLHQIRKMVGLTIAIVRGLTTVDTLTRAWEKDKLDIPIAPGLGLLLEEVHYDRYNFRYGSDGMHEMMNWSKWDNAVEDFRKQFILPAIVETEKKEKSMLTWLDSLNLHSFDIRTEHIHSDLDKALVQNQNLLAPPSKMDALLAAVDKIETAR